MADFIMGRDEKPIREENGVWYHSGMIRFGQGMSGKLILTSKRFAYIQMEHVKTGGLFGIGQKSEARSKGIKINLPIDKVIGASTEQRTRKKGTINEPASLINKEIYSVLIVSLETDQGVENPMFEVRDPTGWANAIQSGGSQAL